MSNYSLIKKHLDIQLNKMDIKLEKYQYNQIYKYFDMLTSWNKVMNLTAITDEAEFAVKHIADSILIHKCYDMRDVTTVIDIGTGAGLPGIPLKIVFPHIHITLLDSLNKRINFLNEVIDELEFEDIETIHGRAEDYGKMEDYREYYDLCVSRAVSKLSILSEYCIPFVRVNGDFVAYKSAATDDEIETSRTAVEILGGKIKAIKEISLKDNDVKRRFVIIRKETLTPPKYPRKAGKPQKKPL